MAEPIKTYSSEEFDELMKEAGLPAYRAHQILSWIYVKNVSSYEEMTNLPKTVREQLERAYPLYQPRIAVKRESEDGSRKYLLELHDGTFVETVGLPSDDGRLTVCCSSQSGCSMGCSFCATGKLGLKRSLWPGEIVDQLLVVQEDYRKRVTNIVMMGQGEPFLNYESSLSALRIMNSKELLNIGSRHITLSTCGIIKGIERFSQEPEQFTLAVSLHSARQETRDKLMPGLKSQKLEDLKRALDDYTKKTGRRFSLEYALMKGINDSNEDFNALVGFCNNMLCHVNLIPLNRVSELDYEPVSQNVISRWKEKLEKYGISSTIRHSRGSDIEAACGQLSSARRKKETAT